MAVLLTLCPEQCPQILDLTPGPTGCPGDQVDSYLGAYPKPMYGLLQNSE